MKRSGECRRIGQEVQDWVGDSEEDSTCHNSKRLKECCSPYCETIQDRFGQRFGSKAHTWKLSMTLTYPMKSKREAGRALDDFIDDVGVPETLIFDNAAEQTGANTDFMKTIRQARIHWRNTEPYAESS
eukprot:scaffold14789_cov72-Cylindrotheca_fusiformis.AAC.1